MKKPIGIPNLWKEKEFRKDNIDENQEYIELTLEEILEVPITCIKVRRNTIAIRMKLKEEEAKSPKPECQFEIIITRCY
jgi:hypothetical protein